MSASRNEARRLSRNHYFAWHALPRSQNRFSAPSDFRRLAGGSTETKPPADRPVADRHTGGITAGQPPAYPFPMPGPNRALAGQVFGHLPALAQPLSRSPLMARRRPTAGTTGANTGSPPGNSPYA